MCKKIEIPKIPDQIKASYERLSENPYKAVDWLLSWNPNDKQSDVKLKTLHLIRAENTTGELYIVKESDQGHFLTFYTPIHLSEEIGTGGEASLAALFVTLELLYKRAHGIKVCGYQLQPDEIKQLTNGNTPPGSLLKGNSSSISMWWEDIWDREMAPKREYWVGWTSLYERIELVISAKNHLNEQRTQIRRGATDEIPPRDS